MFWSMFGCSSDGPPKSKAIGCERRAKKPAPGRLKKLAPEVVPVV
jgi:hypothetical protein